MNFVKRRIDRIELLAGDGDLHAFKTELGTQYTKDEIDRALCNAIAYSNIKVAEFLLDLGADLSYGNFNGPYYAVHNNELEGIQFAINNGVDINLGNGRFINEAIITATNSKDTRLIKWLIDNGANPAYITQNSISGMYKYGFPELIMLVETAIKQGKTD